MKKYRWIVFSIILSTTAFAQDTVPAQPNAQTTTTQANQQDSQPLAVQQTVPQAPLAPVSQDKPAIHSRKGFTIGFGIGGGGTSIGSGRDFNEPSTLTGFRIGGGISERLLILAEAFASWSEQGAVTTRIATFNFSAQYFVLDNLFVRPGVGVSMLSTSSKTGKIRTTYESDDGFSTIAAVGYEFRLGRLLGLSPEAYFNYDHVDNADVYNYGVVFGFMFY